MKSVFGLAVAGAVAACCLGAGSAKAATTFQLTYTGAFSNYDALNLASASTPGYFSQTTAFTVSATFDVLSPNLAPVVFPGGAGLRAYAPSTVTMDIGGTVYNVTSASTDPLGGVTVAIYDQGGYTPGYYEVGLVVDPVHQGAGFLGEFANASPPFVVEGLPPTVFEDFYAFHATSGPCLLGSPPDCPRSVTPLVLTDASNAVWNLTLGSYDRDYPLAHTPGASISVLNTAKLVAVTTTGDPGGGGPGGSGAVPEPESWTLMIAGLGLIGAALRRRAGRRTALTGSGAGAQSSR